jgi:hypothetical protein
MGTNLNNIMAQLIIKNITMNQAKVLASYYQRQGEQHAEVWFEDRNEETPIVDVSKRPWLIVDEKEETVTIICK